MIVNAACALSEAAALPLRPENLIGNPDRPARHVAALLATALRRVRITDSMQYCYMPAGDWQSDATPAAYKPKDAVSFHIFAGGSCWLDFDGQRTTLHEGDIAAFPFGTPHRIGAGEGGPEIDPGGALPPAPWADTPVLRFGGSERVVRILCGYVRCKALTFAPFRQALPAWILVNAAGGGDWLAGIVAQIVAEVDAPQDGVKAIWNDRLNLRWSRCCADSCWASPAGRPAGWQRSATRSWGAASACCTAILRNPGRWRAWRAKPGPRAASSPQALPRGSARPRSRICATSACFCRASG